MAAGRESPETRHEANDQIGETKAPSVEQAAAMGQLILVAEDNVTNQDVIRRQLNLLGYAAEIAADGKQALDAWHSRKFAMLLTDCHMPEMDGFELTRAIRAEEDETDSRFPIVAITANALQGEADRCLQAGMDHYLSKPLELRKLQQVLKKWMPIAASEYAVPIDNADFRVETAGGPADEGAAAAGGTEAPPEAAGAIDPTALKSVFGDDPETFQEILQDFVDPASANVGEILDGFANRSAAEVARAAHKLKSSARAVGASRLADLCLALETAGNADDWTAIDAAAPHLEPALEDVLQYIRDIPPSPASVH